MVIALLALLGVDLVALVLFAGILFSRKRWVSKQPGAFRGAIRLAEGEVEHIGSKWRRGYGRWVRDVLVWTKAPFLFRNELLPVNGVAEQRTAAPGEVKRVGDHPVVVRLKLDDAAVEVATSADTQLLIEPFR